MNPAAAQASDDDAIVVGATPTAPCWLTADDVVLIKDPKVRGSSQVIKQAPRSVRSGWPFHGTTDVEGKVDGSAMMLKSGVR